MPEKTFWESFKAESGAAFDKLKQLLHEGNVRRVRVRQAGRTIAEFPLTAGVVGVVAAPMLAAIGTLIALVQDCTIDVERVADPVADPVSAQATGTYGHAE